MSLTPTTCSSGRWSGRLLGAAGIAVALVVGGAAMAGKSDNPGDTIVRPEGYLRFEGDEAKGDGGVQPRGAFSTSPALTVPDAGAEAAEPPPEQVPPAEAPPPRPARKSARELCQPLADRFSARLSELHGNTDDGQHPAPLNPVLQRAMFGRQALAQPDDQPDQPIPELTWDSELKDLYRNYQKCLKANRGGSTRRTQ